MAGGSVPASIVASRLDRHGALALLLVVYWLTFSACTPPPTSRSGAVSPRGALRAGLPVLVLAPVVRFEEMQTEFPLRGRDDEAKELALELHRAAMASAATASAAVTDCATTGATDVATLCDELARHALLLSRGIVRADSRPLLARAAVLGTDATVLATSCVARAGPLGTYNSSTGQITSSDSRTVVSAALWRGTDGKVAWKNDVLLRTIPEGSDERYQQSLALLFSGAPGR